MLKTSKTGFFFLLILSLSTNALADDARDSNELFNKQRVCVFDIDDTLVLNGKNGYQQAPEAKAVIELCRSKNYGIAIATRKYKYRSMEELDLGDVNFGQYADYLTKEKALNKNNTDIRNPASNPIYIYQTHGNDKTVEKLIANKTQAMGRIMRTYFGISVGGSFVDKNNAYLKSYMKNHNNELPSDKDLSACLVLFDDDQKNIDHINAYNMVFGTKFGVVKVTDKDTGHTGVTLNDAEKAFKHMDKYCKS